MLNNKRLEKKKQKDLADHQVGFNSNEIKQFLQSDQYQKELNLVNHKIRNNLFKLSKQPVLIIKRKFSIDLVLRIFQTSSTDLKLYFFFLKQ